LVFKRQYLVGGVLFMTALSIAIYANHIQMTIPTDTTVFKIKNHQSWITLEGNYQSPTGVAPQLLLQIFTNAQQSTAEEAYFRIPMAYEKAADGSYDLKFKLLLPWQEGLFYYMIKEGGKVHKYIVGGKFEVRS